MALSTHWIKHIETWQGSGLSQVAYCCQHGLNAKSFSGRLSEFRKQKTSLPPALIPVQVSADDKPPLTHVLVFSEQGYRLEMPTTVSAHWLAELLLWDGNGVWLCQRRLHQGRFVWPKTEETHFSISAAQWQWLIAGVDWQRLSAEPFADWKV